VSYSISETSISHEPNALAFVHDIGRGDLEYVRIADRVEDPGALLANKMVSLARGGMLDVVVHASGGMGYGRVTYTPGLKALRKVRGNTITYRFRIPRDVRRGTQFLIGALGSDSARAFQFVVRVA
jgi:hypothetical protein